MCVEHVPSLHITHWDVSSVRAGALALLIDPPQSFWVLISPTSSLCSTNTRMVAASCIYCLCVTLLLFQSPNIYLVNSLYPILFEDVTSIVSILLSRLTDVKVHTFVHSKTYHFQTLCHSPFHRLQLGISEGGEEKLFLIIPGQGC